MRTSIAYRAIDLYVSNAVEPNQLYLSNPNSTTDDKFIRIESGDAVAGGGKERKLSYLVAQLV